MIVDTDILIDVARAVPKAVSFLTDLEQIKKPTISVVTQMELMVGARNKNELRAIERFMNRFTVIKVNENISDMTVELVV